MNKNTKKYRSWEVRLTQEKIQIWALETRLEISSRELQVKEIMDIKLGMRLRELELLLKIHLEPTMMLLKE